LKEQSLENRVFHNTGNLTGRARSCDLHVALKILYLYYFITNYVGNKHKSRRFMRVNIFATLDDEKTDTENI